MSQLLPANARNKIPIHQAILPLTESRWLMVLASLQGLLYAVIAWLSVQFHYGTIQQDRPIILILLLLGVCFCFYLAALGAGLLCRADKRLFWSILIPAIVFRITLLFSVPIQEIDIYRYLWDGAVTSNGVSPYRFSPQEVLATDHHDPAPKELSTLSSLRDNSPPLVGILQRVHYPELPTVYPPVSQAVFAIAHWITPNSAQVYARVVILKAVLVTFDIATIILMWGLLQSAGRHPAWTIAYAWCPLVLKEFANSGHLDSIAVCLTVAALVCSVRFLFSQGDNRRWSVSGVAAGILFFSSHEKHFCEIVRFTDGEVRASPSTAEVT